MDITGQMKDFSLFAGISAEKLHLLGAQATYKTFKQGEMVIGETDPIRSFYVVVSGQLKLYRSSAEGKEQTLQLLGPGDLASFLRHALPKGATGRNSAVELTISQRELAKILGATPEALSRALRKMANDGILATAGRTITILDHKALEQLAEGE
ncbi:MAG: hypothetical protein CVU51_17385 [Deltaproteobacteria bacterium HGW-Deltaproteobacteria-1]|nr:MAG: hypothetical protein CVU51_17385 [Deltaproteobacteria bacterium HGW-Deltaproteobacteria-1]